MHLNRAPTCFRRNDYSLTSKQCIQSPLQHEGFSLGSSIRSNSLKGTKRWPGQEARARKCIFDYNPAQLSESRAALILDGAPHTPKARSPANPVRGARLDYEHPGRHSEQISSARSSHGFEGSWRNDSRGACARNNHERKCRLCNGQALGPASPEDFSDGAGI